jgi:hypothetical protein
MPWSHPAIAYPAIIAAMTFAISIGLSALVAVAVLC